MENGNTKYNRCMKNGRMRMEIHVRITNLMYMYMHVHVQCTLYMYTWRMKFDAWNYVLGIQVNWNETQKTISIPQSAS